jgi:hypothetical protein
VRQCTAWSGEVQGREGQHLAWVASGDLERYDLLPADIPLLPAVQGAIADFANTNTVGL